MDYITHYEWDEEMAELIGKKFKVVKKDFNPDDYVPGMETNPCVIIKYPSPGNKDMFWVPVKCLIFGEDEIEKYKKRMKKMAKKMKTIDPYSEEIWD